jgi:AmiR/NasT family two-component response regulator
LSNSAENLQRALNTRVVIEQAKGVLAERGNLAMEETFELLRPYARSHNLKLSDLAHSVVYPPHLADAVLASRPAPGRG